MGRTVVARYVEFYKFKEPSKAFFAVAKNLEGEQCSRTLDLVRIYRCCNGLHLGNLQASKWIGRHRQKCRRRGT
ncbi:hypothetical protein CBM2626_U10024 [Cupriavidus taiwanensis]|uniref:Uncharacterized protein n=1 Tax=Cupriavidus taiwanensis TaxID=164546 RepID=A0A375HCF7_9BURK|nr:hypothetical protein CBM2614_U20020 [Cupriavidus taiwanensis]SOZ73701.1 hypothetical protein CBM2615_U20019 [Cupriavidus taiwanensis]SOZ75281.1 hypothetical protein CBM2613_U20026 [Cupriavidus taiwanensis]SPA03763.1 hypothetical protein CBM2626_U10024 [Cupriavidus taiwanensis]SPA12585.1 hypothetical protein CBM2625_U10028 [Cupriavidus taiwanensis]